MKGVFHSGVGIEVSARPRVLCGIRAKDLSSQARGDINYRCVGAVNIGNPEIANLQEVVAEPHAVRRHLAFKGIQLAKTAACAGADVDGSVCSPNICKRKGLSNQNMKKRRSAVKRHYLRYEYQFYRSKAFGRIH